MNYRYFCPMCKGNRTKFQMIYKLGREIHKNPKTGEITYESDEMEAMTKDGTLDVDVKCLVCGYVANENRFIQAGKYDHLYSRQT